MRWRTKALNRPLLVNVYDANFTVFLTRQEARQLLSFIRKETADGLSFCMRRNNAC